MDAGEPNLILSVGLKVARPIRRVRDKDYVATVRSDDRVIGVRTIALDARVAING